jgi:hypothetical protein
VPSIRCAEVSRQILCAGVLHNFFENDQDEDSATQLKLALIWGQSLGKLAFVKTEDEEFLFAAKIGSFFPAEGTNYFSFADYTCSNQHTSAW